MLTSSARARTSGWLYKTRPTAPVRGLTIRCFSRLDRQADTKLVRPLWLPPSRKFSHRHADLRHGSSFCARTHSSPVSARLTGARYCTNTTTRNSRRTEVAYGACFTYYLHSDRITFVRELLIFLLRFARQKGPLLISSPWSPYPVILVVRLGWACRACVVLL